MDKNDKILFSIIIPTYNRAHLISDTIRSVLNQTYSNWELILVDDGSEDNTREVVNSFGDNRIKYFYKKNEERSIARNFGIDKSSGKYISFLDDDDYYLPEFLSEFNAKILSENEPVAAFICDEYEEDETGHRTVNKINIKHLKTPVKYIWKVQSSIRPYVFHKDIFREILFDSDCYIIEDFILIMNISTKYPVYYVPKVLNVYKKHNERGTKTKFLKNYKKNALVELGCLEKTIVKFKKEIEAAIETNEIFNRLNHKMYAYASASMKNCDFIFLTKLLFRFSFKADLNKVLYYYASLISRIPYYLLKCIINKIFR